MFIVTIPGIVASTRTARPSSRLPRTMSQIWRLRWGLIDRLWQCYLLKAQNGGNWSILTMPHIWRLRWGWLIDCDNVTDLEVRWGLIDRYWQCYDLGAQVGGNWSIVTMSQIWRLRWGVIDRLWQCHRSGGSGGGGLIDCDNVTYLEAQVGVDWSIVTMLRSGGSVGGNWSIVTMSQIWMLRWRVIDRLWHWHSCGGSDGGWLIDCDTVTVVEAQMGGDWLIVTKSQLWWLRWGVIGRISYWRRRF